MTKTTKTTKKIIVILAIAVVVLSLLAVNHLQLLSITTLGGSITEIQTAINQVVTAGGGEVQIPAGNFLFDANGANHVSFIVPAGGLNVTGAGIGQTILYLAPATSSSAAQTTMFEARGGVGSGKLRIQGITFKGRGDSNVAIGCGDTGILIKSCRDFLIYDCEFTGKLGSNGIAAIAYSWMGGDENFGCRGVISHCDFSDIQVDKAGEPSAGGRGTGYAYGVSVGWYSGDQPSRWVTDLALMGRYDDLPHSVYIEDCDFSECRHAITGGSGSIVVFRHNTCHDMSEYWSLASIDQHPYRSYGDSGMWMEAYDNIVNTNGLYIGGGSALWYNNVISNVKHAYVLVQGDGYYGSEVYPRCATDDVYIWNNQVSGAWGGASYIDAMGHAQPVAYYIQPPGFKQYPYPHPLAIGAPPPPPTQFLVNIEPNPNGTITPAGVAIFQEGTQITLTATPYSGYRFNYWLINGQTATTNPFTFHVTEDYDISANITLISENPPPVDDGEGWLKPVDYTGFPLFDFFIWIWNNSFAAWL